MRKSEIFAEILILVSEETEISTDKILSDCKEAEIVDARSILVKLLSDKGLYPSFIASALKHSTRSVQYILTHFSDRKDSRTMLRINYENLTKRLGRR